MIAINTTDLTQNFGEVAERVIGGEKILVSRPRNENLVVITEREYNELDRLRSNAAYLAKLDESLEQAKKGEIIQYTQKQMRDMETQ